MPLYNTIIPTEGPDGNIFAILTNTKRLMRRLGHPMSEIKELTSKVTSSQDYEEACNHIRHYFPLQGDKDHAA